MGKSVEIVEYFQPINTHRHRTDQNHATNNCRLVTHSVFYSKFLSPDDFSADNVTNKSRNTEYIRLFRALLNILTYKCVCYNGIVLTLLCFYN